ncbi:MAG: YitT family protein [Candidatus Kapabacteria bacterium]|nr:YitT family protein [Candidatus Kapabacteria bacterium]
MLSRAKRKIIFYSKDLILILCGVLSAGFGLGSFLLPNGFIDGGVTGISLLVSTISGIPLSVLIVLINIPFLIIGYKNVNKSFAIRSLFSICALSLVVAFVHYPIITHDKLFISAFGGFFLGIGIGLSMRGGAVIDGTELLAIYLSKKIGMTIGDIILIFNIIIFSVAIYFLSVEVALYAILTYLAASKTVDYIITGIEEYTGIYIFSDKSEEIRQVLTMDLGQGVTIYTGRRGYTPYGSVPPNVDIVFTVITRLELSKLKQAVELIDPQAFLVMHSIKDTKGGMLKKRGHF